MHDELRDAYARGELVAFVGGGISHLAGLPSRRGLAESLLGFAREYGLYPGQLREIESQIADGELLDAITDIEVAVTPMAFARAVRRLLDDTGRSPPALAQALAELHGLRGVITTNLDRLLERAFEGRWPVYTQALADFPQRRGWVFKIHGTLHERETWVLTRPEYGRAIHGDPLHRALVESLFLATPLLFVGCSFDDPDFVAVVERIHALANNQPPHHFALLDTNEYTNARRRRLEAVGIEPIEYGNLDGSHAECVELLRELAGVEPVGRVS